MRTMKMLSAAGAAARSLFRHRAHERLAAHQKRAASQRAAILKSGPFCIDFERKLLVFDMNFRG